MFPSSRLILLLILRKELTKVSSGTQARRIKTCHRVFGKETSVLAVKPTCWNFLLIEETPAYCPSIAKVRKSNTNVYRCDISSQLWHHLIDCITRAFLLLAAIRLTDASLSSSVDFKKDLKQWFLSFIMTTKTPISSFDKVSLKRPLPGSWLGEVRIKNKQYGCIPRFFSRLN